MKDDKTVRSVLWLISVVCAGYLAMALAGLFAGLMPDQVGGKALTDAAILAFIAWAVGTVIIWRVLFLITHALVQAWDNTEKKKKRPPHMPFIDQE